MIGLVVLVAAFPLAGSIAALSGARRWWGPAAVAGGLGAVGSALALAVRVAEMGPFEAWGGFVYVDPLSTFFLVTIAVVVALASMGSVAYLRAEEHARALSSFQVRLYLGFFGAFAALMLASVEAGNLGLLWVLVEASTLASAVLVALEARATSLEAAWKYIIISSFGVTIALVGTLFVFYAATSLGLGANRELTWVSLFQHAAGLRTQSLKLGFLLAVIGYGTKVGLAPMHTWLPDAHSEAPSPASAMLSAALLTTGMYAIIRFRAIAEAGVGSRYPDAVLLTFGFLSITLAALFMVRRGNFKRLFAYSSIEHMGIIAVALGFGGTLGLYGALLQILGHAIGKAVLFLAGGDVVLRYRTRTAAEVHGALDTMPVAGGVLLLASLAIVGSPPFGLFLSEFTIVRAGFANSSALLAGFLLLLLVIAFVFFLRTSTSMAVGQGPPRESPYPSAAVRLLAGTPLITGLLLLLVLGVWIPAALNQLILHSIRAIT